MFTSFISLLWWVIVKHWVNFTQRVAGWSETNRLLLSLLFRTFFSSWVHTVYIVITFFWSFFWDCCTKLLKMTSLRLCLLPVSRLNYCFYSDGVRWTFSRKPHFSFICRTLSLTLDLHVDVWGWGACRGKWKPSFCRCRLLMVEAEEIEEVLFWQSCPW